MLVLEWEPPLEIWKMEGYRFAESAIGSDGEGILEVDTSVIGSVIGRGDKIESKFADGVVSSPQ